MRITYSTVAVWRGSFGVFVCRSKEYGESVNSTAVSCSHMVESRRISEQEATCVRILFSVISRGYDFKGHVIDYFKLYSNLYGHIN
jgi:hypothetical protein